MMSTMALTQLRLYQLISPNLPIGAFAYSQGLEWLVEQGQISQPENLKAWLHDVLIHSQCQLDVPIIARLYQAYTDQNLKQQHYWQQFLIANRETHELRQEERLKGQAMVKLLPQLGIQIPDGQAKQLASSQLASFTYAAYAWQIPLSTAALAYVWGWLENQILAATKLIPLGQSSAQKLLTELSPELVNAVEIGLTHPDDELGSHCLSLSLASSWHETQYTRLFRS